jgi:hypothetical protein
MVRTFMSYALTGVAALALPAMAQQATATQPELAPAAVTATSNQIVVRDGNTGQLRAASPDEAATLREQNAKGRLRVAPQSTLPRFHTSGARGARLTDEFMTFSVVVRQPDGSLKEYCFESREAAEAALKTPVVTTTQTLPTE